MIESTIYEGGTGATEATQTEILQKIATEATLSDLAALLDALNSNGGDLLRVREQGTVSVNQTSTVAVQEDSPLDVSGATVPVDAQGSSVVVGSLPDQDEAEANGDAVAGGGSLSFPLAAGGVEHLRGVIVSTGEYDLAVEWETSTGTVVQTESIALGIAGGTITQVDLPARSPYATVTITDTSGAQQSVDGVIHLA